MGAFCLILYENKGTVNFVQLWLFGPLTIAGPFTGDHHQEPIGPEEPVGPFARSTSEN